MRSRGAWPSYNPSNPVKAPRTTWTRSPRCSPRGAGFDGSRIKPSGPSRARSAAITPASSSGRFEHSSLTADRVASPCPRLSAMASRTRQRPLAAAERRDQDLTRQAREVEVAPCPIAGVPPAQLSASPGATRQQTAQKSPAQSITRDLIIIGRISARV